MNRFAGHVSARTSPHRTIVSSATSVVHIASKTRQPGVTPTVLVASPFSSSFVIVLPTGTFFQWTLVDDPGGRAVRVCQGASVLASRQGRCWVRASCVQSPLMARMAAPGIRSRGRGAMVERDGDAGRPAHMHRARDAVEHPADPPPRSHTLN